MGRWAGARGLRAQVLVALIEFLRGRGGGGVRTLTSLVRVGSPKSLIQPILLTVLGQSSDWPSEVDVPLPNLRCCGSLLAVLVVRRRPLSAAYYRAPEFVAALEQTTKHFDCWLLRCAARLHISP